MTKEQYSVVNKTVAESLTCIYICAISPMYFGLQNFQLCCLSLLIKGTIRCLRSHLNLFVYIRNNVCIISRTRKSYTELFRAVNNHVEFHKDSSSHSVSIALPVIDAFVISTWHSLSWVFVTSTMNCVIFLGSNKIMCAIKT